MGPRADTGSAAVFLALCDCCGGGDLVIKTRLRLLFLLSVQLFFFFVCAQKSTSLLENPGGIPRCVYWSEPTKAWMNDGLVLESFNPDPDGSSEVTCLSFHLSAFAAPGEETVSAEWPALALLTDVTALQKVYSPYIHIYIFICWTSIGR